MIQKEKHSFWLHHYCSLSYCTAKEASPQMPGSLPSLASLSQSRIPGPDFEALLLESIYTETDWGKIAEKMNAVTGTKQTPGYYKSLYCKYKDSPQEPLTPPLGDNIGSADQCGSQNCQSMLYKFSGTETSDKAL